MKRTCRWIFAAVVPFLVIPSLVIPLIGAASPAGAQAPGLEPEFEAARREPGIPVGPGLWRLHGVDPNLGSTEDLAPLRRMIGKATVVGLGESWHTSGGFYKMKHRIFRDLVENMGFRVFAMESHWASGEKANRYVQTCEGSPDEALDLHIPVWQSVEVRELLQWMCEWNQAHPDDRVHYFGFDIQLPGLDGPGLVAFLGRTGIPQEHPWVAGIRKCDGVAVNYPPNQIPPEAHEQCIAALTEVEGHFQRNGRSLQEQTSKDDFDLAKLRSLSLKAYEEQVFFIGDDYFGEDFAKGFNKRDEAMAKIFFLLREKHFPRAKTVVWAANIHVARARVQDGVRPMGSILAEKLGRNYVTFALAAYRAELDGFCGVCEVSEAGPGTVEDRLHALGEDALLVDLARSSYLRPRLYEMSVFRFVPRKHFNGIVFLETSERMQPTAWAPCRP
ncbi:MAG TPA: erythromycin esterase family protein [Thermoanaerobaculia bacterium]|nr:erythromycin esterase family protein [Thermoanaerobaculia bacterium]